MPRITIALLVVVCLTSCYSKSRPETDTEDPVPIGSVTREYDVSFDIAWTAVRGVIKEYSIPIDLIDREKGIVKTEFMSGDVSDNDYFMTRNHSGPGGNTWMEEARYKLEPQVAARSNGKTEIKITSIIRGQWSSTTPEGTRYRAGAWYDMSSTGGIEMQTHDDIVAQLRLIKQQSENK